MHTKQIDRVVDPITQSEKELPADYNPPARLAIAFRELNRLDDAKLAIDRALRKCTEGPRKLRLYEIKADILSKSGDADGRIKTLHEAIRWAEQLPKGQQVPRKLAALKASIEAK